MGQSASVLVSSKNDKEKPTSQFIDKKLSSKKPIVKENLSGAKSRNQVVSNREKLLSISSS